MPIKSNLKPGHEFDALIEPKTAPIMQATTTVEKKTGKNAEPLMSTTQEAFDPQGPAIPASVLAHIHASASMTINLGNYESTKVTVGVTLPCTDDDAALSAAYERASDFVSAKLQEAESAIRNPS